MVNERKKRQKNPVSQLALDSFEAFRPFINIFDCGLSWLDSPIHLITKEDWKLFHRYKEGERGLIYPEGREFKPGRDVICNIYSPRHVQRHMEAGEITYYTSGRNGRGLLYLDIDAHKLWQTDEYKARTILQDLFPFGFFRASRRGQNGYLKIRYNTPEEFNQLADRLEEILARYFLSLNILCDCETKGTITNEGNSGSLAKLPFLQHRFPCNMRDETDNWNYTQLEKFIASPVVNSRRVEYIMGQIQIDVEKAVAFEEYKRRLDEQHKAAPNKSKPAPSISSPVVAKATIQSKPLVKPCTVRVKADLPPQESEDAFRRNLEDLPPFIRAFYSAHRRYPTTEEALEWLKTNRRYSGDWEDKENRRAKRVQQILDFLEPDFNPEMLSEGNSMPVSLNRETYSWWVRRHIGSTMIGKVADIRRFDAITMKAPTTKVTVPARFVETFLAVAEFCVKTDPLSNKAVPTNRIKKIWGMVRNGAAWNQKYFQVVRDRLHRMGVIRIYDRQHHIGKSWRWIIGKNFPEGSLGEQERKLKDKLVKRPPVSLVEFLAVTYNKNNNIHNSLYHDEAQFSAVCPPDQQVRPPPWTIV
jgi:hypothetical protein